MATERLRLLHITEGFDGGVVTFLRHVLPAQCARGIDVTLACSPRHAGAQEGDLRYLAEAGVKVQRVRMGRGLCPWRDLVALAALRRLIRQNRFDIIHTHCFKAGVLGRLAARTAGPATKLVHTPHCFPFLRCKRKSVGRVCCRVEKSLACRTDCLMMVSESQRQAALQQAIGTSIECVVIPNALPPPTSSVELLPSSSLRRDLGLRPGCPVVGTCARLVSYKCVDHLIEAAALVRQHFPGCIFLITGDGPQRGRLFETVRRLGLDGSVRLLGYRSDVRAILSLLDIFVLCSRAEGMPYTLLEAAQAGAARIASAVPGNVDVIEDGRSGLLYPWGRIDRLAEAIVRCLADRTLRQSLAEAARVRQEAFTLDDQVDAMVELYARLCPSTETRPPRPHVPADGLRIAKEGSCST